MFLLRPGGENNSFSASLGLPVAKKAFFQERVRKEAEGTGDEGYYVNRPPPPPVNKEIKEKKAKGLSSSGF